MISTNLPSGDGSAVSIVTPVVNTSLQLARTVQDVKQGLPVYTSRLETLGTIAPSELPQISNPQAAVAVLREYFRGKDREEIALMLLDRQNRVRGIAQIAVGTTTHVDHDPMTILRPIVLTGATAVIDAHNHPCGHAFPSDADWKAYRALEILCFNVRIHYFDSIIIGASGDAYSLRHGGIIA